MKKFDTIVEAVPSNIVDWSTLLQLRQHWHTIGKVVVWTNGCFDLLHTGHVQNLQAAKQLGDILVVGVNSDVSVRTNKGPHRPIIPQMERANVLAAIRYVDFVVIFDESTPEQALDRLRPDIHCKGADYAPSAGKILPEKKIVENYGGKIEFLPFVEGISTTDIILRIRAQV